MPAERELIVRLHATKEDIPKCGVVIDATLPFAVVVDAILRLSRACDDRCRRAKANLAIADGLESQLQDLAADFIPCCRICPG